MKHKFTFFAAAAAICLIAVAFFRLTAPYQESEPGSEIVYDDFGFIPGRAEETRSIGSAVAESGKSFYIVDIAVSNHAKRVSFDFDPRIVKVRTAAGDWLPLSDQGQRALETKEKARYSAGMRVYRGGTKRVRLVFSGKSREKKLFVRFIFRGTAVAVLDALFYGNREVRLPVQELESAKAR